MGVKLDQLKIRWAIVKKCVNVAASPCGHAHLFPPIMSKNADADPFVRSRSENSEKEMKNEKSKYSGSCFPYPVGTRSA